MTEAERREIRAYAIEFAKLQRDFFFACSDSAPLGSVSQGLAMFLIMTFGDDLEEFFSVVRILKAQRTGTLQ